MSEEGKSCCGRGHKFIVPLAAIIIVLFGVYLVALVRNTWKAYTFVGRSEQQIYSITIAGEGKVTAIPDIATISLGLQTEKLTVADAQKENTDKMNQIIKQLTDLGIETKDIQTSNYSIYPNYNWDNGKQTLRDYQVNQTVEVKIRDLTKVGTIVDAAGQLGANQVSGLSFTIDEPEKLKQEAREKALQNAKEKADALAKIAGVKLGKLVSFSENSYNSTPQPIYRDYAVKAEASGAASAVVPDIQTGSQDIIIDVSVTYEVL